MNKYTNYEKMKKASRSGLFNTIYHTGFYKL